ncbi:hypothetical protein FHY55_18830 [Oceanicola sp. D3]|uniref:DUF6455 family protein n=1 Tax=Oceanicola sp. D3 TaxID=2587163 RepID=UPI001122186A|nr:DUF6455 family protein [Oceanicola sp. D3]QDC11163.1 hypothetical protein FHY55_18830 [Oceanicola sp. D3]
MKPLGDERTHYLLAMGMAKATRTDLAQAMEEGALDSEAWSAMVTRCRGCGWAERCGEWLDTAIEEGANCPPSCVNQRRFEELRARSEQARRESDRAVDRASQAIARVEALRQSH